MNGPIAPLLLDRYLDSVVNIVGEAKLSALPMIIRDAICHPDSLWVGC